MYTSRPDSSIPSRRGPQPWDKAIPFAIHVLPSPSRGHSVAYQLIDQDGDRCQCAVSGRERLHTGSDLR